MDCKLLQIAALLLLCGSAAATSRVDDLYQASAIVTGKGEQSRAAGLASALAQVLVKVSGDPRFAERPDIGELAGRAGDFVASFRYRDRMAGIPVHDEQGTRDRPYDLIVDFDPAKIDTALRSLGGKPWNANRPELLVLVGVGFGAAEYLLASEGERGRDQREALTAEAQRFGVPVILPSPDVVKESKLDVTVLDTHSSPELLPLAERLGADAVLSGQLTWSKEALGWVSNWRLSSDGKVHSWRKEGGSFDQAFRTAVTGAAQILSGNGQPD